MFHMLFSPLQMFLLLPLSPSLAARQPRTFQHRDPVTGAALRCERCPPGSFLLLRCSSTQRSVCAPCPDGSFTALWNHVGSCLRCRACSSSQVVKSACTSRSDCRCECAPGFYFKPEQGMCTRHSECPSGQGVERAGTPDRDTVCGACTSNHFSDVSSSRLACSPQRNCSIGGTREVLSGSAWHDRVCRNCTHLQDGAFYLREILPAFFLHHQIGIKRLRRVAGRLVTADSSGTTGSTGIAGSIGSVGSDPLDMASWLQSASSAQIRRLPSVLSEEGAGAAAERLRGKLRDLDSVLQDPCDPDHQLEINFLSETS